MPRTVVPTRSVISFPRNCLASGLVLGVLLTAACGDAPKPVTDTKSDQKQMGGYGSTPPTAPTAPAAAPAMSGGAPAASGEGIPPLPEALTKLEKEYSTNPKNEKVKGELIEAKMNYANDLMYGNYDRKLKYRVALKHYREVLQIDPANKDAAESKNTIEGIYRQMGIPIPS